MDHKSFIVGGNKRCISYQSLSKALYVEPHQGLINSGSPSRSQLRRIIKGFEKAGLIKIRSANMHLILKCFLANSTKFVQNKPVTNPTHKAITSSSVPFAEKQMDYDDSVRKSVIAKLQKAATLLKDNYYIYLLSQFEHFWSIYPEKKSKHKARVAFEQLNPNPILFQQLIQKILANVSQGEICSAHPVTRSRRETISFSSNESYNLDKRIDLLFFKFAAFYDHIWRSQFKDEVFFNFAKKEWQDGLSDFTDEVLTQAILNCQDFYELPPTLPQVIHCCLTLRKRAIVDFVTNDYIPANLVVALSFLQQCQEIVAK